MFSFDPPEKPVSVMFSGRSKGNMRKKRVNSTTCFLDLAYFDPIHFQVVVKFHSSQPVIKCSKLTIETLEQGVKYVQS